MENWNLVEILPQNLGKNETKQYQKEGGGNNFCLLQYYCDHFVNRIEILTGKILKYEGISFGYLLLKRKQIKSSG